MWKLAGNLEDSGKAVEDGGKAVEVGGKVVEVGTLLAGRFKEDTGTLE